MTGSATTVHANLRGLRVLVVEDEYMIAEEIAQMLAQAGATTLGPVPTVEGAMRLVEAEDRIDGALLDVNVSSQQIWPALDLLLARGVPVVLATGYDASAIPLCYAHLPRCDKPACSADLARVLAGAVARAGSEH